jgi:hypothetical protein
LPQPLGVSGTAIIPLISEIFLPTNALGRYENLICIFCRIGGR